MKTSTKDRIRVVIEVLLVGILLLSGFGNITADVDAEYFRETGSIVEWLGAQWALYFYGAVFLTEAVWLAYAKWFKKKNSHKYALFTIYITTLFTILLEILLAPQMLVAAADNVVIAAATGWAWLQWKMKIDYINPDEFRQQLAEIRRENEEDYRQGTYQEG